MVVFCFCWFLTLYGLTFILAKGNDLFAPLKFVSIKYLVLNLSFILYIALYPKAFDKHILKVCNVTLDEAFLQYTIVQTVAYISLLGGILLFNYKKDSEPHIPIEHNYSNLRIMAIGSFGIALSAYLLFLHRIGGIVYLLNHLNKRVELQGNQYILGLLPLLIIAALLLLLCVKLKNKVSDKFLLGVFIVGTLFIFNSLATRLPSLIFIVTLIIAGHYIIRPLRIDKKNVLRFGALGVVMFFYILLVPVIRREPAQIHKNTYTQLYSVKAFVYNLSYTYIDVFAANYFNEANAWNLKGFFEPVSALFAQNDKSMIPQVDQGVYFRSIVEQNKNFTPPLPRKDVSKISWPTENFGFAYANFLIPGIIIFFFLQGVVFSLAYRLLVKSLYNPIAVLLYVEIIFNFNFSSLKLAYFIKIVPLIYICYVVFNKFVKKQNIARSFAIKL